MKLRNALNYDMEYKVYLADIRSYKNNHSQTLYEKYTNVINRMSDINSTLTFGTNHSYDEIIIIKNELAKERSAYIQDAKNRDRAEAEKKAAEEKAKEEAEAKAQSQARREKAEREYVEPKCYSWPPTSESITRTEGIYFLHLEDKQNYYGMTGWSDYNLAFQEYADYASDWLFKNKKHFVYIDGECETITLTDEDVQERLVKLSTARKRMVVENYVNPNRRENPDDCFVFIARTGSKYHSRSGCPGLNGADTVYHELESDAILDGKTKCERCY
jgi:hypothetical protein